MEETLGESKLKRVNSPSELVVGKKYFYFEADEGQLYRFRVNDIENMDFIPKVALCRRTLIYEGKDNRTGVYNFKVIEDTPDHCNREGISLVGDTVPIFEYVFKNNNQARLYHSKIIPEVAFGAGKKYRTKRHKSKKQRTRKNKRKTSLRKNKSKNSIKRFSNN